MTTYTLHKELGFGTEFPAVSETFDPTHHATQAAMETDSASCSLDEIVLPSIFRLRNDGTVLVGWRAGGELDASRAAGAKQETVVMAGEVFEADVDETGSVTKVCVRVPYSENHDVCLVFNPNDGTLITLWANHADDTHDSLDVSRYDSPDAVPALA